LLWLFYNFFWQNYILIEYLELLWFVSKSVGASRIVYGANTILFSYWYRGDTAYIFRSTSVLYVRGVATTPFPLYKAPSLNVRRTIMITPHQTSKPSIFLPGTKIGRKHLMLSVTCPFLVKITQHRLMCRS